METLLQRFHFGAVIRLHFGTTMTNGSQHVQETHRHGNLATALPFWSRYSAPFWDHYEQRVPTCGLQNGARHAL